MKDPLSVVLEHVKITGSIFQRAELRAPFAIQTKGSDPCDAGRAAIFHIVTRGEGVLHVTPRNDPNSEPSFIAWKSGDILFMPYGDPHTLSSSLGTTPQLISTLPIAQGEDGLPCLVHGGEGERASLLCGTMNFSQEAQDLIRTYLPPCIHVRAQKDATAQWLDATIRLLQCEATYHQPGDNMVLARLAEVIFIHVLRSWIQNTSSSQKGWIFALNDAALSHVLALIHNMPATQWTAEGLARRAGLSRSALYARFTETIGEPPRVYLARWRMRIAQRRLREGARLAEIAEEVGYASEAAFSRAFKRVVGVNPSMCRVHSNAAMHAG